MLCAGNVDTKDRQAPRCSNQLCSREVLLRERAMANNNNSIRYVKFPRERVCMVIGRKL